MENTLTEIGVDIMDNRPINEKIALRICSERELNKFNRVKDKQSFLMELWCKKESLVKKSGIGFNKGFISKAVLVFFYKELNAC